MPLWSHLSICPSHIIPSSCASQALSPPCLSWVPSRLYVLSKPSLLMSLPGVHLPSPCPSHSPSLPHVPPKLCPTHVSPPGVSTPFTCPSHPQHLPHVPPRCPPVLFTCPSWIPSPLCVLPQPSAPCVTPKLCPLHVPLPGVPLSQPHPTHPQSPHIPSKSHLLHVSFPSHIFFTYPFHPIHLFLHPHHVSPFPIPFQRGVRVTCWCQRSRSHRCQGRQ